MFNILTRRSGIAYNVCKILSLAATAQQFFYLSLSVLAPSLVLCISSVFLGFLLMSNFLEWHTYDMNKHDVRKKHIENVCMCDTVEFSRKTFIFLIVCDGDVQTLLPMCALIKPHIFFTYALCFLFISIPTKKNILRIKTAQQNCLCKFYLLKNSIKLHMNDVWLASHRQAVVREQSVVCVYVESPFIESSIYPPLSTFLISIPGIEPNRQFSYFHPKKEENRKTNE